MYNPEGRAPRTTVAIPAGTLRLPASRDVTTHQAYPYFVRVLAGDHPIWAMVQIAPAGWRLDRLVARTLGVVLHDQASVGPLTFSPDSGLVEVAVPTHGVVGVSSLADYVIAAPVLRRVATGPDADGRPGWRLELRT